MKQVTNHGQQAIGKLLEQFKGKAAIEDLVSSLVQNCNSIESDSFGLLNGRINVATTSGIHLTNLARMFNVSRSGLSDADLRTKLTGQLGIYRSNGTRNVLISICQNRIQIIEASGRVADFQAYSRNTGTGVFPDQSGTTETDASEMTRRLNQGRSGGVYFTFEYILSTEAGNSAFRFDTVGSSFDDVDGFRIGTTSAT